VVGKARKPPLVKTSAFTFTDVSITLPTLSNYTSFTSPPPFSSSPQLTLSFHLLLLLPLWTHPQALILMPSQTPCPCTQRYSYLPVLCTIILITHSHTLTLTHTLTSTRAVSRGRNSRELPFLLVTVTRPLHPPREWLLAGHGQTKESLAGGRIASNSAPGVWHLLEGQTVSRLTVTQSPTSPGRLRYASRSSCALSCDCHCSVACRPDEERSQDPPHQHTGEEDFATTTQQ